MYIILSKVFSGKVLGLSWKGDVEKAGGICQKRVNVGSETAPDMYNLNSLFITLSTKRTPRIPLRMGVLNLAHELLHSFGARHDSAHCRRGSHIFFAVINFQMIETNSFLLQASKPEAGREISDEQVLQQWSED